MKLGFFRSKVTKEQLEKQAIEELEAAVARAKPPTEAERTWVRNESGDRDARSRSIQELAAQPEVPETPASSPAAYGPGVVVEDEPLPESEREPDGLVGEHEYGPGVVVEDEPLSDDERQVTPAPPAPRRTAPSRARGATASGTRAPAAKSQPAKAQSSRAGNRAPASSKSTKAPGARSKATAGRAAASKSTGRSRKA